MRKSIVIQQREIDLDSGEIRYQGTQSCLEPKVLAVLKVLLAHQGSVISQEDLLNQVWGEVIVAPNALQRCITLLRKQLGDDDKRIIQTFPKLGYRLQMPATSATTPFEKYRQVWLGALFAVISLCGLVWLQYSAKPKHTYRLADLTPLTHDKAAQYGAAIHHDQIAYFQQNGDKTDLLLKDLRTQQTRTMQSQAHFYGSISFSPKGDSLVVGEVTFVEGVKCAQLRLFNLALQQSEVLLPCYKQFLHSAKWLDNHKLIYMSTDKIRRTELYLLPLTKHSPPQRLTLPEDIAKVYQFNVFNDALWLSGVDQADNNKLWQTQVEGEKLSSLNTIALTYPAADASLPLKLANGNVGNGNIVQSYQNQLFIYDQTQLITTLPLASPAALTLSAVNEHGALLATAGKQNMLVRERQWQNAFAQDTDITTSDFSDASGQYQPFGQAIAYLSNRSGRTQLWLQTAKQAKQLTFDAPVNSFVWQADGKALWFSSNGQLQHVSLQGIVTPFTVSTKIKQLLQHGSKPWLLALDSASHLIQIDTDTGKTAVLLPRPVNWAQQLESGKILFSPVDQGKLYQFESNQITAVEPLADIILQWRFFVRDNAVLLQDKQKNIWRYQPDLNKAEIVAQFDEQALFATDFRYEQSASEQLAMLSDNFAKYQANIVQIGVITAPITE
ncbi:winged helix-turn-helix domain-containing protein [Pseudoalteromonas fenneropenaei]|uniref:Winged helix-turn-helix domain-containing protein n=1 Tax=Pseudoalteromonas fenneropenaei TaxID=1737459 RepID=A0ABV7CN29_9GAMM